MSLLMRSWGATFLVPAIACSSAPTADPTALSEPIARDLTITRITMLQALEVPVMQDGSAADRGRIPLVALRDSLLRIFVSPDGNFSPHDITARARIVTNSPMGSFAQVFSATQTISGDSVENDLSTTIQIPIPGIVLEPGASVTVVLNDDSGDASDIAASDARWPQDGSAADLDVRSGSDRLRVEIVPVEYVADGSHRTPDTSDAQLEAYRQRFFQLYPTAEVDLTVHDVWPYDGVVSPDGSGMDAMLQALQKLRSSDQPDPDVYYYAAVEPAADVTSFCGAGCVSGLSFIGMPLSVGIGYSGEASTQTAVHEVGHGHGRQHAPCGGASSPDPNFPYPGGLIGVWGYDTFGQTMIDPSATTDMMSYCKPTWISDYHYGLIFNRVRKDNGYANDWIAGNRQLATVKHYSVAPVAAAGAVRVTTVASREPWITLGEPREVSWDGGSATAYWFPYDHLPGGALFVPDEMPSRARVVSLREGEAAATILR